MQAGFIIMPIIISFMISAVLGHVMIPMLKRLKVGQTVREDGPDTHLKKSGTPTMGGVLILISITLTSLLYVKEYPKILPVLFLTLGFGLIGFLDDCIKVVLRRSMGLKPWQKMLLQLLVTGAFAWYLTQSGSLLTLKIPFLKGYYIDLGNLSITAMFVIAQNPSSLVNPDSTDKNNSASILFCLA